MRYGRIEQMFAGGRIETLKGTLDIPTFPASSAGPDLREFFLGTEGRMGIITEVKARVTPLPEQESFHVLFFPTWEAGLAAVREIVQNKMQLSMMRLSNRMETITQLKLAGGARVIALLEKFLDMRGAGDDKVMFTFGVTGSRGQCKSALRLTRKISKRHGGVGAGPALGKKWEHSRFRSPYLRHGLWESGYAVDTMETAIDWVGFRRRLTEYRQISPTRCRMKEKPCMRLRTFLICTARAPVFTRPIYSAVASTYEETYDRWKKLKAAGAEAIVRFGGTISHQHGVGKDHANTCPSKKVNWVLRQFRG